MNGFRLCRMKLQAPLIFKALVVSLVEDVKGLSNKPTETSGLQIRSCLTNIMCASRLPNMVNQQSRDSRLFHGHNNSHIHPMTVQRSTTERVNKIRELLCTQQTLCTHAPSGHRPQVLAAVAIRSQEPTNPPSASAWRPVNVLLLQFSIEALPTRA